MRTVRAGAAPKARCGQRSQTRALLLMPRTVACAPVACADDMLGNPPRQDGASMNALQRDGLVHCCLYFIAAHRLKGVDLEFMRRLQPYARAGKR